MDDQATETKRARVRRLLIEPLEALGFRRGAKMTPDVFKKKMGRLLDDLAYLSDDSLAVLYEAVHTKGQGRNRDVWPQWATFYGFAELIEPRPVAELPALLRWFRSVEGPKALHAGTLVETWQYFQRYKRPPKIAAGQINAAAVANQSRAIRIREREQRGSAQPDDVLWLRWYERRLAYCEAIVRGDDLGAA